MLFGKYRLIRKLAAGGMAEIFLARQEGMEGFSKLVVIKRILPVHADNEELIQMFLDEARIAAGLTHPHIVQIYELGQHGDFFIAMEFVHGMDLRHICERGMAVGNFLPLRHAVRIIADTAAGLHYAHNKTGPDGASLHIVHRDISPQNILVSFEGTAKITDFGIAKAANKVTTTRTGQVKGKFAYMSPEQCNAMEIDHRSDIFALGTILYEITVVRRLFKGDTDIQTIQRVSEAVVTPPTAVQPHYPRDLEYIVMKALRKDPRERFQSAREMQMALEDFLTDNRMKSGPLHVAEYMKEIFPDKLQPPGEDPSFLASSAGFGLPAAASTPPAAAWTPAHTVPPASLGVGPVAAMASGGPPGGGRPGGGPPGGGPPGGGPPGGGRPPGPPGGPPGRKPPPRGKGRPPRPTEPEEEPEAPEDDAPKGAVSFVANPNAPYEVGKTVDRKKKERPAPKRMAVKRTEHNLRAEDDGALEGYERGSRIYYLILGAVVVVMLGVAGYLIVSRGNFFANSDLMNAAGDNKLQLDADLGEPPPPIQTVSVNVNSDPQGASIVVNGVLQTGQTPGDFQVIPGSINTVSVYLEDHMPQHRNIDVKGGGALVEPVAVRLEKLELPKKKETKEDKKERRRRKADEEAPPEEQGWPKGRLTLGSVPDAATVYLDGKNVGVTPLTVEGVAANVEHHLTVRKSGYLDHVITQVPYPNEEIKLPTAQLVPEDRELARYFTEFRLEPSPRDIQLYLNDELVGTNQLFRNVDRNQAMRVELKLADYHPYRRVIATTIGSFMLRPEMEKINHEPGTLTLNIQQKDIMIFVGAEQLEDVKKHEMPSGKYTVTLVKGDADGERGEIEVVIDPNAESEYTIDFSGKKPTSRRVE